MAGELENFKGKAGSNNFANRPEDINRKGRPLSFKKQYKQILQKDKAMIWVDADKVVERKVEMKPSGEVVKVLKDGEIPRNGIQVEQYGFELHGIQFLLYRLNQITAGANEKTALEAIKFLWEQFDGKAKQTNHNLNEEVVEPNYENLTDEEIAFMSSIHEKMYGKNK